MTIEYYFQCISSENIIHLICSPVTVKVTAANIQSLKLQSTTCKFL